MAAFKVAEREGFEPPDRSSRSAVFKTAPFNHSGISPRAKIEKQIDFQTIT